MKLSERQQIFTQNIGKLITKADDLEIGLTFGEAYRTKSQQLLNYHGYEVSGKGGIHLVKSRRLSWTMNSRHLDRLAVDFNFFVNGRLIYDAAKLEPLGTYWESLHSDNAWGGRWDSKDVPHFEMKL